ncbi:MAG: glycerate kinase [Bacteroidales bacterium]|nr:glycerate kinase [Bacteroidales bacterium]
MKIVIAQDSFKDCLSARAAADAFADAVRGVVPGCEVVTIPLADGGEGTAQILTSGLGGQMSEALVSDPLGRRVKAAFGVVGHTAVIEVCSACGIQLLSPAERNPLNANSFGVGELLLSARKRACRTFLVGLGGTAVCDGGEGMMSVPGIRESLKGCSFELLCDVDNPFIGPRGAARVFAPQKGATPQETEILEKKMTLRAETILKDTGVDVRDMPGAGAAGGLSGALMAYFGATTGYGISRILEIVGFARKAAGADLVITGEGKSDSQTLAGKVPYGVLKSAQRIPSGSSGNGIPVAVFSGRVEDEEKLLSAGFRAAIPVSPEDMPVAIATNPSVAAENIRQAIRRFLPDLLR